MNRFQLAWSDQVETGANSTKKKVKHDVCANRTTDVGRGDCTSKEHILKPDKSKDLLVVERARGQLLAANSHPTS